MYSPCKMGVEVLLKSRLAGTRFSGQRNRGCSPLTSTINPLINNRFPWKTGVAAESLLLVTMGSRQLTFPFAGSSDASELSLQTINCRFPAASIIIGELFETGSSNDFQTSFPVSLFKAMTLPPGLAPVKTIKSDPSINGEGRQDISATWYSRPMFFSQMALPLFTSRQCVNPLAPTV